MAVVLIDIGIGSWSVSIPIQGLDSCVLGRLNEKAAQIPSYGFCLAPPIGYFRRMAQVKSMYDKPVYVQT